MRTKEQILKKQKEWRSKNKDKVSQYNRKYKQKYRQIYKTKNDIYEYKY